MSLGATGVAAALRPSLAGAQTPQTAPTTGRDAAATDADIFNLALNLESLETARMPARILVRSRADAKCRGRTTTCVSSSVPSTADGIAFSRTPQQVLRIVYLSDKAGVTSGGLFPKGMKGTLRST